jgi:hypothetical protein
MAAQVLGAMILISETFINSSSYSEGSSDATRFHPLAKSNLHDHSYVS